MRPRWSLSNSLFPSHDPALSPLDEGATLSSATCPLITCTGSRLIFTIEDPSVCTPKAIQTTLPLVKTLSSAQAKKHKEKCLKNTSKHRICPTSVCSIYGDSSVTFIGDWLTKVVCWCCTCPESSPSVKSESVDSSLVCIPRSPHPFKRITAPCIHFHTT